MSYHTEYFESQGDDDTTRFIAEIFISQAYAKAKEVLGNKRDAVVIDIGAHRGLFTDWIYDYASKIYCIEPQKDNLRYLHEYKEKFDKDNKITIFEGALSDTNGVGYFSNRSSGGGCLIPKEKSDTENVNKVKTKTLFTFMKENNIEKADIVKFDIEGGERAVLLSPDFEEAAKRIEFIVGEAHIPENLFNEIWTQNNFKTIEMMSYVIYAKK